MRRRYVPYEIDMQYEFKTYKNIGRDYGNSRTASVGFSYNVMRFFRKLKNRKQKKYLFCNTYSEWERHIHTILDKNIANYRDLHHWLIYRKRGAEQYLESIRIILIPVYIALIGAIGSYFVKYDEAMLSLSGMLLIIVIGSAIILHVAHTQLNFFNDFIEIAEKQEIYRTTTSQEEMVELQKEKLNYRKTYDKAIKYLAAGECPPCEYDDTGRNEECIYCMEHDLDNQEKKIACWRKQFETE